MARDQRREELHSVLVNLLGSTNVYFQPPASLRLQYPCIVYHRDTYQVQHADNHIYSNSTRYQVSVIDADPDSIIPKRILELPLCSHSRFYTADNLNHDVFTLYF